jgi:hypothetical protein
MELSSSGYRDAILSDVAQAAGIRNVARHSRPLVVKRLACFCDLRPRAWHYLAQRVNPAIRDSLS